MKVSLVSNSSVCVILGSSKGVSLAKIGKMNDFNGEGRLSCWMLKNLFGEDGHATVRAKPTHYMPTTSRHIVGAKRLKILLCWQGLWQDQHYAILGYTYLTKIGSRIICLALGDCKNTNGNITATHYIHLDVMKWERKIHLDNSTC